MASRSEEVPAILGGDPIFGSGPPGWPRNDPAVWEYLNACFASGDWGQYHGSYVPELEGRLRQTFAVPHALVCSSGTLAVQVALHAAGVGSGDAVLMAAYDYDANFLSIHALGAVPVLTDVDARSWCLRVEGLVHSDRSAVKAILCSHLHGGLVDIQALRASLGSERIVIIEDAAQAPGATLAGRPVGSTGDIGILSFGGSKLLTAGRGGALLFHDQRLYQRARQYLTRGSQHWGVLSELQAAVLIPQLETLDRDTWTRLTSANQLCESLLPELRDVMRPLYIEGPDQVPAFYKLGFQYDGDANGLSRDQFVIAVQAEGIALGAGFRALHVGRSPSRFRSIGTLDQATRAHHQCVVLHHPVLLRPREDLERVAQAIKKVYRNADQIRERLTSSGSPTHRDGE